MSDGHHLPIHSRRQLIYCRLKLVKAMDMVSCFVLLCPSLSRCVFHPFPPHNPQPTPFPFLPHNPHPLLSPHYPHPLPPPTPTHPQTDTSSSLRTTKCTTHCHCKLGRRKPQSTNSLASGAPCLTTEPSLFRSADVLRWALPSCFKSLAGKG